VLDLKQVLLPLLLNTISCVTHCNQDMVNILQNTKVESPPPGKGEYKPGPWTVPCHILQKLALLMLVTPLVWCARWICSQTSLLRVDTVLSGEVKRHMHSNNQHLEYSTAASGSIAHSVELQAKEEPQNKAKFTQWMFCCSSLLTG